MLKVATFSRTSTDNLSQSKSIGNQEDIYKNWIDKNNCILYRNYIDEGISGTKAKYRVEWNELIKDGLEKNYDILLCKSYSRFGRNMLETLSVIKSFRELGIRIIFLEDGLDSEKDASFFGLFSWLAEQESRKTSERIKTVFSHFKETGKMYNCVPPLGYDYDIDKKIFVINEEEAEIVRRIFSMYLAGNGTAKIARILSSEGIKGKNDGVIRGNTIKNCILNEVYLGTLVQNKTESIDVTVSKAKIHDSSEWIKHYNNHEPIISEEVFKRANKLFKSNSDKAKQYRFSVKGIERSSNASLFSNLLTCNNCGCSLTIRRKKNKPLYYNCCEYEKVGTQVGHKSNKVLEKDLIELVVDRLNKLVKNNFESINISSNKNIKSNLESQLRAIEKAIKDNAKKTSSLMDLYTQEIISLNQFKIENESLKAALDELITNKEILKEKIESIPTVTKSFEKDVETVLKTPTSQWNNAMLKSIINKIYIDTSCSIKLRWFIEK